jgi:membrane-associated phospholipid phosphatase
MFSIQKERLWVYLKLSLFQSVLFVSVYGFTNWLALKHTWHFELFHPLELQIPLIPAFILGYVSLNVLMWVPAFSMSIDQLHALNRAMTWATLIAGLFFLLMPAPVGFIRTDVTGFFASFYQKLYHLDEKTNTFPSLHITFSFLFVRIILETIKKYHVFFWAWFCLIAVSVLLTHQHHLIDIAGGILLAEMCFRKIYVRTLYGKH